MNVINVILLHHYFRAIFSGTSKHCTTLLQWTPQLQIKAAHCRTVQQPAVEYHHLSLANSSNPTSCSLLGPAHHKMMLSSDKLLLLEPTAHSRSTNRKNRKCDKTNKRIILCYANNLQGELSEGVYLANGSEEEIDELNDCFEDDFKDDLCYANWKKGCHFCRSVAKNTKPKIRPHKRVKVADKNRTTRRTLNVKENVNNQKENIQKRLDKMNIKRIGFDIYDPVETAIKMSLKTANKRTRKSKEGNNKVDHPNALKYELKHDNDTKGGNQTNRIADLQHRDINPEDYDLLLLLDESIAPKTVSTSFLTNLRVVIVDEANLLGELCAICMDAYQMSDKAKQLPCNHFFHQNCIDNWLSNASPNCPLDGVPVES